MGVEHILAVEDVTVSFDGFKVLDDLNFSVKRGEFRFLIGPNGAGKTTLLDIITGKTKASKGKVMFDNRYDVSRWSEHRLVRQGVARKFQTPSVFGSLSVYENLETAIGFRTQYYQLVNSLPAEKKDMVDDMLETIGLAEMRNQPAAILSHGQKQWLEIGMLLVQEPKLLLLDEPVAGMSRSERSRTGELLNKISDRCSILLIEHDMVFVRQFASTVTVLHMGKVLCEGPVNQVQNNPEVVRVYLGHNNKEAA
ncbi:MAG: urea ABC transporter ATP-binding protein UrtD [Anaerolineae bacterium]|nr:urea ABC transporter ATP-binding protein UrtD [Anaerolineae bacterium]